MTATFPLFVYGTLKRGGRNHGLLAQSTFRGVAWTAPGFALVDTGTYPGMFRRADAQVLGELFDVPRDARDALDELEGHPHLFVRTDVELEDGRQVVAYLLCDPGGFPVVEGGEWAVR